MRLTENKQGAKQQCTHSLLAASASCATRPNLGAYRLTRAAVPHNQITLTAVTTL